MTRYVLTLSCKDRAGIVAAVSSFLAEHGGFIVESAQFGDPSTGNFFMRTVFDLNPRKTRETSFRRNFLTVVGKPFSMEWQLHNIAGKTRVLLMVSQSSHCLNDILHRYRTGNLPMEITAILSNHNTLKDMAKWYRIPFHHLPVTPKTRKKQEASIQELVRDYRVDLVVLARYMQILSDSMCNRLHGRAINIHHSFLPGFKGANPYQQAYDRGVKIIGATAHYVTAELDEGPIIAQETIHVNHAHDAAALKTLGQDIESRVLARAIQCHIEHRVLLNGNKTIVFN